jgi:hypothetical protein
MTSPGAASTAIGVPTETDLPGSISVRTSTPSASAGTSTTAFSVSTVAIASPAENAVFSASGHSASTASTVLAEISGILSSCAIVRTP